MPVAPAGYARELFRRNWRRNVADFRLRIGFAKTGPAIWLSHLEVVRAMERCVRRSGLPCVITQGFSPRMRLSCSSALPVGTGSTGEYLDVELSSIIEPEQALRALQTVEHESLPVLSARYVFKDEPSLQVYYNLATYRISLEDPEGTLAPEVFRRLEARPEITLMKKGKPKSYALDDYLVALDMTDDTPALGLAGDQSACCPALLLKLLSLPEGSLRPEVILAALAKPNLEVPIQAITRIALEHQELPCATL